MKYINFVNQLENNNIKLFDAQYRVSYQRLHDVDKIMNSKQYGGSSKAYNVSSFVIINNSRRKKSIKNGKLFIKKSDYNSAFKLCNLKINLIFY